MEREELEEREGGRERRGVGLTCTSKCFLDTLSLST